MAKILIIDDDNEICHLLNKLLNANGYETAYFACGKKALTYLNENPADLVFCDYRLPDLNGKEVLVKIKAIDPQVQVVIMTGYSDIKIAVDIIKNGAYDFILKPLRPEEFLKTAEQALAQKIEWEQLPFQKNEEVPEGSERISNKTIIASDAHMDGRSVEAAKLHYQVALVAPTSYSVIIYGESGTGKESVAYTIHKQSARKNKPFIAVDCGSLTKELAGSELFGHEKGSFPGAIHTKTGHFELADGGTIFLDEIGNLSYDIQVSLLRVIQERKIRKIGSEKEIEIEIDVRILVASNEKLNDSAAKGKFREDLFHRFNEFSIELPPLRERNEDIMIFAGFFLRNANFELGKDIKGFAPEVQKIFLEYDWPGNLREMNNIIRRSALLANTNMIVPADLPAELASGADKSGVAENENRHTLQNRKDLKSAALEAEYHTIKYHTIMRVLQQVNYNKSKAALLLNIDRKTLYNKMHLFDLMNKD